MPSSGAHPTQLDRLREGVASQCILGVVRFLGVDYGLRRIGLALSDASGTLASPWRVLESPANTAAALHALTDAIAALMADDDGLAAVIVGWPRRLDGSPTHLTAAVEDLARRLREQFPIPVVLQDERLSSAEAESRLAAREKDWRQRKKRVDAAAAAIVLQDYLDHRPSSSCDSSNISPS